MFIVFLDPEIHSYVLETLKFIACLSNSELHYHIFGSLKHFCIWNTEICFAEPRKSLLVWNPKIDYSVFLNPEIHCPCSWSPEIYYPVYQTLNYIIRF